MGGVAHAARLACALTFEGLGVEAVPGLEERAMGQRPVDSIPGRQRQRALDLLSPGAEQAGLHQTYAAVHHN